MIDKLCIVIVTYRRQELLSKLFDSILKSAQAPWHVVLVDNENSSDTAQMVRDFNANASETWGNNARLHKEYACDMQNKNQTASNQEANVLTNTTLPCAETYSKTTPYTPTDIMIYAPQTENLGGSGGFSAGVRVAYDLGAEWFWLMDDDVAILPDAIEKMEPWTQCFDVIQGRRYDFDGGAFYWQNDFRARMAIHNPLSSEKFNDDGYLVMTNMCFEGGMFRRNIVEAIGLPDPRFFIYWDDAVYGYLATKVTTCVLVNEFVLQRTREIKNREVGKVRQLNSTSDTNRYYIMRNRGYIAQYLREQGDYNPFVFGVGTALELSKEGIRLLAVDRGNFESLKSGLQNLARGWHDAHKIMRDKSWKPMPTIKN